MASHLSDLDIYIRRSEHVGLKATASPAGSADRTSPHSPRPNWRQVADAGGIEVTEEPLRTVSAQLMYKMRCECGRSWFELEAHKFVSCPACHKPGLVTI